MVADALAPCDISAYWLYKIGKFLSYITKDFIDQFHCAEELYQS